MKKSKFTLILMLGILIIFQSCNEKELLDKETQVVIENSEKTLFFLDNNEITESDYELYNQSKDEKFVIITTSKTKEYGVTKVINAYSSEDEYI